MAAVLCLFPLVYHAVILIGSGLYLSLLRQNQQQEAKSALKLLVMGILIGGGIVTAAYMSYLPICFYSMLPAIIVLFFLMVIGGIRYGQTFICPPTVYILGNVAVVVMVLAPLLLFFTLGGVCTNANLKRAEPIIDALEAYQAENGYYPERLSQLVPDYITELPYAACSFFTGDEQEFYLYSYRGRSELMTLSYRADACFYYNLQNERSGYLNRFDCPY